MSSPINATAPASWQPLRKAGPVAAAFLATLMALPVNAGITLPNEPLTTASRVPPNILFILDDSGSMVWDFMPGPFDSTGFDDGNALATTPVNIAINAYTRNTLYYNPHTTYQPWTRPDGTLMTGGTSYTAAYSDTDLASGTINLSSSTKTFYVPKPGITNEAYARQYYRYQIVNGTNIVRSEYGTVTGGDTNGTGFPKTGLSANAGTWLAYSFNVPAGSARLVVSITGGNGDADLYVRYGSAPTATLYDCRPYTSGSNETCTIDSPNAGTFHVSIHAYSNISNIRATAVYTNSNRCGSGTGTEDWINCTSATPTGRSVADELTNYATWYSYHRTRMKAAKAGAGAAFGELGADVRVGFRTIWNRNNYDIPVNSNQGVFSDGSTWTNRTTWYNRLYGAEGNNGTPLRGALNSAGNYFSGTSASGPYGPESGSDQMQCRQNFSILTTDGYWNSDSGFSSGGNQDGVAGNAIARPDGSTYTYAPSAPYRDGYANTLADVAMYYWKTDLRTDMANIVPTTTANPAFWQHMVTFGISIGLSGRTGFTGVGGVPTNFAAWEDPTPAAAEDGRRIDDLLHAALNSRGTFLSAGNPQEFTSGLKAALATITERTGSFSNVAANTASLSTGAQLFQATYVSGAWTGDVVSFPRNSAGTGFATAPAWRASTGIPATGRRIYTSQGLFPASATSAQLAALDRNGATDQYKVTGALNAAYIAGARDRELQNNGNLRNRTHLFGDVVSSTPAYVSDTNTLYVGANDGMLHAINAANGNEVFAFIPNGINWSDLSTLSRPDYSHRYFVDGPVVVSTRTQTPGQNVLVGALGKGGKGLFALDVSNPGGFDEGDLIWEKFADNSAATTADNNIGLIQGRPVITRLNNGVMALVVGNGINSTNGRAVLLVYNLSTGALIREIDTGVGSAVVDHADSNGLSAPVGWNPDGNTTTDYFYAGDMLGNLWKFDLSSTSPAAWGVANSGSPLFQAVGPDGSTRQAITGGVTVARHPTNYKTWVFFGTGRFLTAGDVANRTIQNLYGVIDEGSTVAKSALTQRNFLLAGTSDGKRVRTFEANTPLPNGSRGWYVNLVEPPSPYTAAGERVVSSPQMSGSVLVVSSIIPTADACQSDGRGYQNSLDAFTGTATKTPYFDINNDGNFNSSDGLPNGSGYIPIGSVDLGVGMGTMPSLFSPPPGSGGGSGPPPGGCAGDGGLLAVGGSTGGTAEIGISECRNTGRVSWREVRRE